ncbi:MAG: hypothetical protein ACRYFX_19655 [Janthinobacterium lividum]
MKQIREWLEKGGQDYAQGVALYEAHGKSRVVLTALRRGASDFTRQKLREALAALSPAPPTAPGPVPPAVAPKPAAVVPAPPDESLCLQRSSWYAERHRLHGQLELLPTDEERRVASERIVVVSELLTDSYQTPGAPAEAVAPRPNLSGLTDQGEIRRLLANLRPRASKLKKNPARALDLQQVQAAIILLESKLQKP